MTIPRPVNLGGLLTLCCVLLGLVTPVSMAQTGTVEGTVRDNDGLVLPGTNVVLAGTSLGAATDADGRFRIERIPPGSYTVRASAIGFRTAQRPVSVEESRTATVDFVLIEEALQGGEVVVTASRREQRFEEVPVSISVVEPRALEERNIVSLDEALRYVPGVQMADNQVNIRGSSGFSFNTGSRVLLLLDGMPLLSPDRESIPYDALPIAQIARVEVVKGPGSALYGGGALGGVINVITKDFPEVPETSLRAFVGVYEPVRYPVWRDAWEHGEDFRPFGGFSLTHARRFGSKGGGWLNVAYRSDDGYVNFHKERDLDVFLKLGWRPATTLKFDLLTGLNRRTSDSFLYWNGVRDALNPGILDFGGIRATGTNDNLINLISVLPSVTHAVNARLLYAIKARLVGVIIQPLEDDGTPKPISSGTIGFRYGGEAQMNWIPSPTQHITIGITGDALATESSFFQPDSVESEVRSQPERAAFLQLEQRLFDRLDLVAGLRYDLYDIETGTTEKKLSPKLNASLPLGGLLTLRLAYGQGFRVPSLGERLVDNQAFLPIISNPDLLPEESTSYELGLRGLVAFRGMQIQHDVAFFWTNYERLVEPKFIPNAQAFQFVNLTEAQIRGLEAGTEAVTDDERWRFGLSYTLLDADDLTAERPLAFRSRHLVKAAVTAPLIGPFSLGLDYRYASAPERVDSDFARFVRDAETVVPVKVLDARLMARWRRFRFGVQLKNALEYYYVERPAILAPPRHVIMQLQVDL